MPENAVKDKMSLEPSYVTKLIKCLQHNKSLTLQKIVFMKNINTLIATILSKKKSHFHGNFIR